MNRTFGRVVIAAALALTACASCAPLETTDGLPASSPETLVARARRFAIEERWSALYDLLSARRRDERSRLEFVLGVSSQRLGPPANYRLVDVIAKANVDGILVDPANPTRALVFAHYSEAEKPALDLEVLIVREDGGWKFDGPSGR